jgi:hypothetical protein
MEHQPHHNPHNREPGNVTHDHPELEGIDLTGSTQQDDELHTVIGLALNEAIATNGELPDWGARAIARALADRLQHPTSSALHDFAISGRADTDAIQPELIALYHNTDTQTKEWVDWLGSYLGRLPEPSQHQG